MSAEQNLALVKAAYEAFGAGDAAGAMENMADDVEWIVPGNSSVSGTYRGKAELGGFWMKLANKSFTTVPEYFLADDERVVALTHTTTDGQPSDAADVSTIRNGKLVKFQTAMDTALLERVFGTT